MSATLEINAAIGGAWDALGAALTRAGLEDASGSRRHYAAMLGKREYDRLCMDLKITTDEAEELRQKFVAEFGEPSAQREVTDGKA